jgi:hypothetical protein
MEKNMTKALISTRTAAIVFFGLALAFAWGCKPKVKTPSDFAQLREPGFTFKYRAISSDEVTIALKKRKNDPKGDVSFWAKVLKEKVPVVYGYTFSKDEDITTNAGIKGKILEFEVTQDEGKYVYMVGVFIKRKKMWLFEAGGREDAYKSHRKAIVLAMKSMKI